MKRTPDIPLNSRSGRWTAIGEAPPDKYGILHVLCRCDCGTVRSVSKTSFKHQKSLSCGCKRSEAVYPIRHGHARKRRVSPTFTSWASMIQRCTDPNHMAFDRYGGRGITVCEQWMVFGNFLTDMGERPSREYSIERVNNALGYSPDNCAWATRKQQTRNTCRNKLVTFDGRTQCIAAWAEELCVPGSRIRGRIDAGWDPVRALTSPVTTYGKAGAK